MSRCVARLLPGRRCTCAWGRLRPALMNEPHSLGLVLSPTTLFRYGYPYGVSL